MRKKIKIPSLMVTLLLTTIMFVPYSKVIAQGLVEYAVILAVVGAGNTETAELYWRLGPSQAKPQKPVVLGGGPTFTYIVTNTGESACSQTIQAPVEAAPGLNILRLSVNQAGFLVVNGEQVGGELADCLRTASRLAYQVGVSVRADLGDQRNADPKAFPAGFTMPIFLGACVVGPDGESTSSSSWTGRGQDAFVTEVVVK